MTPPHHSVTVFDPYSCWFCFPVWMCVFFLSRCICLILLSTSCFLSFFLSSVYLSPRSNMFPQSCHWCCLLCFTVLYLVYLYSQINPLFLDLHLLDPDSLLPAQPTVMTVCVTDIPSLTASFNGVSKTDVNIHIWSRKSRCSLSSGPHIGPSSN